MGGDGLKIETRQDDEWISESRNQFPPGTMLHVLDHMSGSMHGCRNPSKDDTDGFFDCIEGDDTIINHITTDHNSETTPPQAQSTSDCSCDFRMTGAWEPMEPTRLFAVGDGARPQTGKYIEICVDSGCGRSTTGPTIAQEMGYAIRPTVQSRNGHFFVGPGGEKYFNQGDVVFNAADERSRAITTKFNVAEGVEQALGSVAEMTDVGNLVLFDKESGRSCVIPGRSPEAARIRKAAEQCKTATKIYRRKNTYYIPIWVQPEASAKVPDARMNQSTIVNKTPFQGQGR